MLIVEKVEGGVAQIMMDETMNFIDNPEESGTKEKIIEAQELMESSKEMVSEIDSQIEECKVGISQAADDFNVVKRAFMNETFKTSEELLEKVGVEDILSNISHEPFELFVDSTIGDELSIDYISSGRFSGMILSFFAGLLTFSLWVYLAIKNLNLSVDKVSFQGNESYIDAVLLWIGGGFMGMKGHSMLGALILGFSVLVVVWLVYAMRVHFKAHKNLRIAKKTYVESKEYTFSKDECKKEMLKVDKHLRESIVVIDNITFILNEQNAILQRIVHIEGIYDEEKGYHPNSKKVMRETQRVIKSAETLLNTPITKNGKINPQSQQALASSSAVYADFIARIYD